MILTLHAVSLAAAFALDAVIGDPAAIPHPVRLIGALISASERATRRIFPDTPRGGVHAGLCTWCITASLSLLIPATALILCARISIYLAFVLNTFWCFRILAAKSLRLETMRVFGRIAAGDIAGARKYLSRIVGRDTEDLDFEHIERAVVETAAENTSDGVIAPLIYMAVGGAPLGMLYKAVNTMDSMLGYKNKRYIDFGRYPAKIDDVFNFIPARLTALAMIAVSGLIGLDRKNAFRIYRRDKTNHPSPNSAHPESACAGALGVELGGSAYYFGELHVKRTIGDPLRAIEAEDIIKANRLMYASSLLMLAVLEAITVCMIILI